MDYNLKEPQYGFSPPTETYVPPKTNGKSIAGLVLGILSLILPYIGFFIGIGAIVFSAVSLKEIKRRQEKGKGMAIAGLVCGIVAVSLYVLGLLIGLMIGFSSGFWGAATNG